MERKNLIKYLPIYIIVYRVGDKMCLFFIVYHTDDIILIPKESFAIPRYAYYLRTVYNYNVL